MQKLIAEFSREELPGHPFCPEDGFRCNDILCRAVGMGGIGGVWHPPKIGRYRIFGKLDARLAIYSEIKKYVYIAQMNDKMAAFKYIVQCYKCNCSLIEENREYSYFPSDKTCHYAENMSLFG